MLVSRSRGPGIRLLLLSLLLLAIWEKGSGQLHYSVPEEAKHGTFVGRIAQDLGLELEDLVPRLFRVASKGRADLLEVNLQNGILFVNSRIDREELCGRSAKCGIPLEVIVERPLQVFHVDVEVKDINDNPPVFSVTEQRLSIPESRLLDSRFPLEGASDADVGENAMLTYKLSPNDFFILDIINKKDKGKFPVLVLRKLLNREENPQFKLLLTATDGGKPEFTGSVSLLIQVLDANDNAPMFDRSVYEVKMYENEANQTLVIQLNASDADEGINKEMTYSFSLLVPPIIRRKFLINERTGEIKINDAIDFEDTNTYEIHIDVTDKGTPPMVGHCTVLVEILDENDNSPEIDITSLSLPVKEDAQMGTVIALISVSDKDSGVNGQVTCSLTPHVPFKLVSTFKNYYSLVLDSALDRESISDYTVVVTARDGGSPSLWATASVGQAPKASSRAMVGAAGPESTLVDVNVYLIIAICAVSSLLVLTLLLYTALRCSGPPPEGACGPGKPTLVCSSAVGSWSQSQQRRSQRVCSGEGPPKTDLMAFSPSLPPCPVADIAVEERSVEGDHFVKEQGIKRKILKVLRFPSPEKLFYKQKRGMLAATPGGRAALRLLLSLLLVAAWEAESGQLHYSVPEEAKHGTFVGRIAQDLGLELEDLVPRLFRMASKGRADLLEVNLQNGILFVNSRIDREELCGRSAECSIHLEVIVDRPLQVFHVDVEVKDINDNPPVFPATQKNLFISETRALDSHFSLEGASDADVGANAQLTYRLSPNEYFSLDIPSNDEQLKPLDLVLKKPLDREVASELLLVLRATDGGKPELTGILELHITVLDVNDNAPMFDKAVYNVKVLENARNGTPVIRLNASDLDEGSNSHIVYSFASDISSNIESSFRIDADSGEIKVNGKIDFEEKKLWKIPIEAVDKGNPPMVGHCTILVEVLDINDNAPELVVTSLSLPVREDAPVGTVIALISVTDPDSSANGQVTCSLTPNVPFKLVSTFKNYYSLVLDSALDRESISDYTVVVTARDGGSPSLWATASVSVEVADVNDNAPLFAQPEYTVLLVLTLLLYTALRCSAPPPEGACGPGKPTLVCSSAVGSWSYSQQRRSQRVCSGEGPPKTDLMAFSPCLPSGSGPGDSGTQQEIFENAVWEYIRVEQLTLLRALSLRESSISVVLLSAFTKLRGLQNDIAFRELSITPIEYQ
ncbi:Protocadherin alpha-10 [Tupaia chinensis]|uniref:Protocadherin alpha-10 n=1 Tax=Tupaia chinensis TaxID=246437 RepID=L9JV73_TUPCH|nr:Protocadherin alpha-10 [Tupaia chinensis]